MSPTSDEQLKRKSKRALWVGIFFAFLFAVTWGFPSGFGWLTFPISGYCFFLAIYWQPRTPRQSSFNGPFGQQGFSGAGKAGETDIVKQVVRFIALGIFGLVGMLMVAEMFIGGNEEAEPINFSEEELMDTGTPKDESSTVAPDWLTTGNDFYAQQQYDSAEYYYDRVLADDPQNSAALYNKGLTRYERQDFEAASNFFEQSYDLGMRTTFLSTELAQKYAGQGNIENAVAMYKEALGQDSTLADVYSRLAELDPINAATYLALQQKFNSTPN